MARILIVEDELTVRELVRMHLETVGHTVITAADGAAGLATAEHDELDLVIADASMPTMDGFAMLTALRRNPRTRLLPVIFLSALEDRDSVRRAMNLGADDFLSKPVTRQELLKAVEVRLSRFEELRVTGERAVATGAAPASGRAATGGLELRPCSGTLLYVGIRDAAALVRGLNAAARREAARLIQASIAEPIIAQEGTLISTSAQRCLAFFDAAGPQGGDHASRAARAALLTVVAARHLRKTLEEHFGNGIGERFSVAAAVEAGSIEMGSRAGEMVAAGALLEDLGQVDEFLGAAWSIAIGADTLKLTGGEFECGRVAAIALGSSPAPRTFVEILGFSAESTVPEEFSALRSTVADAVVENDEVGGRPSVDSAEDDAGAVFAAVSAEPLAGIDGYRILHRLGEGGMSKVYLARHDATGERRVLKMVPIDQDEDMLQRFLQEYALIAQVRHPNVARIFEQGFGERYAYISMEYLSGGDLRARLSQPLPAAEALGYLTQIALGLTAIHQRGIVHRDLKPENLMFRADGLLVLADFGIAKQLTTELTHTQHGEVYGTPFYMSPEQARGLVVDGRSDLYSLGVILFEMLTAAKPYNATRAEAIVYQHIHAPIPTLPDFCASMQFLLDRLLAKEPEERFDSALDLLRLLRATDESQWASPAGVLGRRHAVRNG